MAAAVHPVRVALVNDFDVVLAGVARMLAPYADRVEVVEIDTSRRLHQPADVALYDTFAQAEADRPEVEDLVRDELAHKVAVYSWNLAPHLVDRALRRGVHGYLSKALPARELVDAIEAVHAGQVVVSPAPRPGPAPRGQDWPGRSEGLTEREAEVLALLTQGRSNAEIAELTTLTLNTVKSYLRTVYRKIGVSRRTQAALWGIEHGFAPDRG